MSAARAGHASVVVSLLKAGAEVNVATRAGWTALFFAAKAGHTE